MYNHTLKAFVCAADCGSFTKAAEKLYISPTAVMKQINTLEGELGVKLFYRTNQGIILTRAGESVYKDARYLFDFSQKAIERAREIDGSTERTFCIGTSLLNPCKPFMDLWQSVGKYFDGYKLHIVPFEDNHMSIVSEIALLGIKFDFLIGVCDSAQWLSKCSFKPLGKYKKCVAVPTYHRLAGRKSITLKDLYGENLMMVKRGDSPLNDRIRDDIEKNHPLIHLVDTPQYYDINVFNRCSETGDVLLTIECWRDVHPLLVTIPVEWDYSMPYGLLYAKNPPSDVQRLVDIAAGA
ncbi:MAG: LysR family transcriptional regulator [Oscillospiraceae bacterium]|nr:LysR family transcriptional regulator [Oscillospiraceae bacterium]